MCCCDSEASSVSVLSAERRYCQRTDTPNRSLASGSDGVLDVDVVLAVKLK